MASLSMSRRARERQEALWIPTTEFATAPGNPFYRRLNELLREAEFDRKIEDLCEPFYADGKGRPGIAPGIYMRMLMVGYFEGIDSERGIAWRCADSLSLKEFLGYRPEEATPDHSSLSRIRMRLDLETHQAAFDLALSIVAEKGLLDGKSLGVDSTTMEANAALRSIVRRDDGRGYNEFLTDLAEESGVENPTRKDLAKIDRKRPKKGSNADWESPTDPEARITRMKDGSTHLAHCAEHAIDMKTGAIVAATIQDAAVGDTTTIYSTLVRAFDVLVTVLANPETEGRVHDEVGTEIIGDKGYHSNDTMETIAGIGCRSYISEPDRGRRRWSDKEEARDATYKNRARMSREKGKRLMRKRGELIERSFAHTMESGAMRRAHLRGHENIMKRYHLHTAAFNLGLVMRQLVGAGTPKGLHGMRRGLLGHVCDLAAAMVALLGELSRLSPVTPSFVRRFALTCQTNRFSAGSPRSAAFPTAC